MGPGNINFVSSVPENTPARFSRLQFKDEIVSFAFAGNGGLKIEKGVLTNSMLEERAAERKTLVLALKRS